MIEEPHLSSPKVSYASKNAVPAAHSDWLPHISLLSVRGSCTISQCVMRPPQEFLHGFFVGGHFLPKMSVCVRACACSTLT